MAFVPCALVAAVVLAVFSASGCSDGSGSAGTESTGTGTNASATVMWAGSLCSALTSYTTAIKGAGASLKGGSSSSRSALESAAAQVDTATDQLVAQVGSLGKPNTSSGTEAKQAVGSLADDLRADSAKIEEATSGVSGAKAVLSGVSVVSGTLVTAADQVAATVRQLQALDPKGELNQAFSEAPSCAPLVGT